MTVLIGCVLVMLHSNRLKNIQYHSETLQPYCIQREQGLLSVYMRLRSRITRNLINPVVSRFLILLGHAPFF